MVFTEIEVKFKMEIKVVFPIVIYIQVKRPLDWETWFSSFWINRIVVIW